MKIKFIIGRTEVKAIIPSAKLIRNGMFFMAQSHLILRNYWVSRFFFRGSGSVRKPNLPGLGMKI